MWLCGYVHRAKGRGLEGVWKRASGLEGGLERGWKGVWKENPVPNPGWASKLHENLFQTPRFRPVVVMWLCVYVVMLCYM